MRLNLGSGRAQLPTWKTDTEHDPMLAHVAYHLPESAYDKLAGWVNVDAIAQPGVDKVVDLFSYPWPFADKSVDEIWASHIVEHIPHEAHLITSVGSVRVDDKPIGYQSIAPSDELRKCAASDGFYAWFYEVWRILKPDGLIHIVCPYALGIAGMSDPQHRRYVTVSTFGYLAPQGADAPFDYQLPFAFEAIADAKLYIIVGEELTEAQKQYIMMHEVNRVNEIAITLRAVK